MASISIRSQRGANDPDLWPEAELHVWVGSMCCHRNALGVAEQLEVETCGLRTGGVI